MPGIALLIGPSRFNNLISQPAGVLMLIGAVIGFAHLAVAAGIYYHTWMGDAESLANYSLTKAWLSPLAEYLGLIMIAIGLLLYKKK